MITPSPFDFMAYTAHQHALHGDPWRNMKIAGKISQIVTKTRSEKAQKGKDMIFSLTQNKEFHVYSRAGMPKCKN